MKIIKILLECFFIIYSFVIKIKSLKIFDYIIIFLHQVTKYVLDKIHRNQP